MRKKSLLLLAHAGVTNPAVNLGADVQGDWVGNYGAARGHFFPAWTSDSVSHDHLVDVTIGTTGLSGFNFSGDTADVRALESEDQSTRRFGVYYTTGASGVVTLTFGAAWTGDLYLYMVDWDASTRRQTVAVNDGSTQSLSITSSFNAGVWMKFPISAAASEAVTITLTVDAGANAVLGGIFLGAPAVQTGAVQFPAASTALFNGHSAQHGQVAFAAASSFAATGVVQMESRIRFVASTQVAFNVPYVRTVDPSVGREPYRVVIADVDGDRYGELADADIESITWVLNGTGTVSLSTSDRQSIAKLAAAQRELHIYRGRSLIWAGPVVRKDTDGAKANVGASSLEWYFTKRHIGKPNRTNWVTNPSFEAGMAGWNLASGDPSVPVAQIYPRDVSVVKSPAYDGYRACKITMAQSEPACLVTQSFVIAVDVNNPDGDLWTFVAWFYIEDWQGPAHRNAGLSIQRASTTETVDVYTPEVGAVVTYPKSLGLAEITFDTDTPRGRWVRAEIPLVQPVKAGEPEFIGVGMAGIQGTIYWDLASLTRDESLLFNNVDQALIVKGLVEHAQDPAFGKSSLNIGTDCQLTGVKRNRKYMHHDHQQVADAISEFPTLANGVDLSIEASSPTSRTFRTHFPYKGYRRNNIVLELGRNIESFTVQEDGEAMANSVVVLGDGDGSDREEGGYSDPGSLGGLVLEKVYNSTPGAPISTLTAQAERGVNRFKYPVVIPTITTYESVGATLINQLQTGDVVRVKIDNKVVTSSGILPGTVDVDTYYRIIQMTLYPNTDRLTLTINPMTEEVLEL